MYDGGCRCGKVRYELDLDTLPRSYACHCLDCQTYSGTAFSQQILVAEAIFCNRSDRHIRAGWQLRPSIEPAGVLGLLLARV